jgi:hypothetical protein
MNLVDKMREHETRSFWSMRWVIVASFLQGAAVIFLAMDEAHRERIPEWLLDLWGVLEIIVAALAAIAATMHPKGGVMALPLGPAIAPTVFSGAVDIRAQGHPAAPAPPGPARMPEDAPAPAPIAARAVGDYTPHPETPTSPNEPSPPAPEPAPNPDTTPIPVPAPPAPPAPAPHV